MFCTGVEKMMGLILEVKMKNHHHAFDGFSFSFGVISDCFAGEAVRLEWFVLFFLFSFLFCGQVSPFWGAKPVRRGAKPVRHDEVPLTER